MCLLSQPSITLDRLELTHLKYGKDEQNDNFPQFLFYANHWSRNSKQDFKITPKDANNKEAKIQIDMMDWLFVVQNNDKKNQVQLTFMNFVLITPKHWKKKRKLIFWKFTTYVSKFGSLYLIKHFLFIKQVNYVVFGIIWSWHIVWRPLDPFMIL